MRQGNYLYSLVCLYHDTFPKRPGSPTWPEEPQALPAEFHELGLGEPLPISAAHGDGVHDLVALALAAFPAETTASEAGQPDAKTGPKIAVVGRPNVGKSTLVNAVLGEERMIAFDQPGTTRDSIYVDFERGDRHYTLIDTAGLRRRRSVHETVEKFSIGNYQQAKFDRVLVPVAAVALAPAERQYVDFDAFFTHILMHELMHGLGPRNTGAGGSGPSVRSQIKELYSTIEEAKADTAGLWALQQLMDKGVLDRRQEKAMYTTFLASTLRSLRFGTNEAHGKGMAVQANYLLDQGGFRVEADGSFVIDYARIRAGVEGLSREIMTIQATGDYAKARALLDRLGNVRPEFQRAIDRLSVVPVDIAPRYVTAEELVRR